jgi:glycosyltransferase involved in cell wall biosynthesis/ubiquinone/menaquinone biosynthesis C-methylase UbiE
MLRPMTSESATAQPRIGILVVAYNAEATLEDTLDRIPRDFRHRISEIIVADDASGDDTFGAGIRWQSDNPDMETTVVRHLENRGYGGNQKAGYRMAIERGLDVIVMLHADGQYAPEYLPQMVAPIIDGEADAVFGSRMLIKGEARRGGMPLYKFVGNRILSRVENLMLGTELSEFHSGYRAYSVEALRDIPFEENHDEFDFDTQIIVQLVDAKKRIHEIPIPTYYGDEICYVDGIKYAKDVVKDVVQYKTSKMGFGTATWVSNATEYGLKQEEGSSHTAILRILEQTPPGKVLDIGCSSGQLSNRIRELGHYVVGVDHAEEPDVSDHVDEFMLADLDEGLPEVGGGYDVVVAADVIEHVRNPVALLREMADKVGPDGRLVISTPNFAHWYPRLRVVFGSFDYDRRGILDETHLRFFSRRGLLRVFKTAKLHVESLEYTGLPFTVLQPGRRGLRERLLGLVDRWLVKARPTLFGYQFVAVLRPRNFESHTHG